MCWLKLFGKKETATLERPSPKIRITAGQVKIENGTLTVTGLGNCFIAAIAPTNSMEPVIDDGMLVVLDPDVPVEDIIVGDIIWYKLPTFEAIHRVIEIDKDEVGWYAKCQGDNNYYLDPVLVRAADVKGVWVATLDTLEHLD